MHVLERELAGSVGAASAHAMVRRITGQESISMTELMDIANIWVDAALQLKSKDLKTMARFVLAQNRGQMTAEHKPKKAHLVRTKQDRRINPADNAFPLTDSSGNKILYDRRSRYDRRAIDIMQISN